MAVTGCIRWCFIILNCIFWVIGLFLVGFMAWTMATNPALTGDFVSGTRYFTYTILSAGLLVTVAGLFGCIGGMMEGTCLLKTYIFFVILIFLIEIGGGVAAHMMSEKLHDYRGSGWEDFNTDTKNYLQKELKCCGFSNYTEYSENITSLPDSCFTDKTFKNETNLYEESCWSKIDDWLNGNMVIWAGTIGGVGAVEILCVVFAIVMLWKINKASKVSQNSSHDGWDDRTERWANRGLGVGRGHHRGVGRRGGGGGGRHRSDDDYY